MLMGTISALFVRHDSIYKSLGIDSWDQERNAMLWPGGNPIIAHPPCRLWGKLRRFSNANPEEKKLAIWAIQQIREHGGVLEHPAASKLWDEINLPKPGTYDEYGGFSICVNQSDFGHPCAKKTLLYIKGLKKHELPPIPISFEPIMFTICSSKRNKRGRINTNKKECSKKWREATPELFAKWLIQVAGMCKK